MLMNLTSTRRLHEKKKQIKTDYSHQKQHSQLKHQITKITRKQKWEEKQLYGYFKRQTSEISYVKTWTWLRKGNLKSETDSSTKQRHKYNVKAKIDITQQKSRCRLCRDWVETINHIISECSKLTEREYRSDKVFHWELCKKFKFDHTNKWYVHNPASILENKTHKVLRDVEIHTDHLISARRPYQVIVNKREKLPNSGLFCPSWLRSKTKGKRRKRDKYLDLARELINLGNMKVTVIPIVNSVLGTVTKGLVQRQEDFEIKGRVETILTTALLRSARIPRRVLETLFPSDPSGKPSANVGVKSSQVSKIIIIIIIIIIINFLWNKWSVL